MSWQTCATIKNEFLIVLNFRLNEERRGDYLSFWLSIEYFRQCMRASISHMADGRMSLCGNELPTRLKTAAHSSNDEDFSSLKFTRFLRFFVVVYISFIQKSRRFLIDEWHLNFPLMLMRGLSARFMNAMRILQSFHIHIVLSRLSALKLIISPVWVWWWKKMKRSKKEEFIRYLAEALSSDAHSTSMWNVVSIFRMIRFPECSGDEMKKTLFNFSFHIFTLQDATWEGMRKN